jgi:hypothetical protein
MNTAIEIDSIIWNTATSPDRGRTAQLAAYGLGYRSMQIAIPFSRLRQMLNLAVKFIIATFDQQDMEAVFCRFKRNHDAGRPGPHDS